MTYTAKLTLHGLASDDPPRRLMEEALERFLEDYGDPALVTIEYQVSP